MSTAAETPTTPPPLAAHAMLPLGVLKPSPTNPRKRFAEAALLELAATIEQKGVMQPLLARPNPEHSPGDGLHPYEIVAGERRWRACRLLTDAGRPYPHAGHVPVIVQPLADGEVLALQALENIQREDLHPLEEAEHYWLMTTHPRNAVTVVEVATMIGKSEAYVYGRMGLRRLVAAARDAFYAGTLDLSKALKVAAMPVEQQAEIVSHITTWGGEPMGARAAERFIHDNFTLQLQQAPWNLADAQLVLAAGACTDCQKRSDRQTQLFAHATEGDRCLDTTCWGKKRAAFRDWRLNAATTDGYRVLRSDEAAQVMPPKAGGALADGWHDLAARVPAHLGDPSITVQQALDRVGIGTGEITALLHPVRDTLVYAVPAATLQGALRRARERDADAAPPAEPGKQPKAADAPATGPAPAAQKPARQAAPAQPEWDPLDDLLPIEVLPAGKVKPDAVELFRQRAITLVARGLIAHKVAQEVRHRGQALGAMLPKGVHGLMLLRMVGDVPAWLSDTPYGLAVLAKLAGVAAPPPGEPGELVDPWQSVDWIQALDWMDATCLAWVLMTLADDDRTPQSNGTWRSAMAAAVGVNPVPLDARAKQVIDERLQIELLERAEPAKRKPAAAKAGAGKGSRGKPSLKVVDGGAAS